MTKLGQIMNCFVYSDYHQFRLQLLVVCIVICIWGSPFVRDILCRSGPTCTLAQTCGSRWWGYGLSFAREAPSSCRGIWDSRRSRRTRRDGARKTKNTTHPEVCNKTETDLDSRIKRHSRMRCARPHPRLHEKMQGRALQTNYE